MNEKYRQLLDKWNKESVVIINENNPSFCKNGHISGVGNSIKGIRLIMTLKSGQKIYVDENEIIKPVKV